MTLTVTIPDASASRSKMQKKGWKCWAKWLSEVKTPANDGYAYEGEFTSVGTTVEAEMGDVLLQVDQSGSADLGVVMATPKGVGWIKWLHSAPSGGRQWCGPLARPARALLAMATVERIAHAARATIEKNDALPEAERWQNPEVRAHYERLVAAAEPAAQGDSDGSAVAVHDVVCQCWDAMMALDAAARREVVALLDARLAAAERAGEEVAR